MEVPSLLRTEEHRALRKITLNGRVLDLGGDARSSYADYIQGDFSVTRVNLDQNAKPDLTHDLEQPLPFDEESYDHVLLINILEHVYDYRQLLREAARVVKKDGIVVVIVPFLFPVHPSPDDYWRFSESVLVKECGDSNLRVEELIPLGSGVFAAQYLLIDRLLPNTIRIFHYLLRPVIFLLDKMWSAAARLLGKKYKTSDYALGYALFARKDR